MSKRPREAEQDHRPPKRPKPDSKPQRLPPEEIQTARQLQHLLSFAQDGIQQLRHGIASFKSFLDGILYKEAEDDRARKLAILREYLESQQPSDAKDPEQLFLAQLWQAWSFAIQNNNDQLASSIAAIIALLLKALSNLLEFREYGLLLSRTVLQHQHLRLVKRGLDAPKGKDAVISPCLRLLIEVASFDGGVLAKDVYKRRELTFDVGTIRRLLSFVRTDIPEEELHRRSSIRTWTVRYILVLLKYLQEGGKIDLLRSRPICSGLFAYLQNDPADLIKEMLDVIEKHVLKDTELPRSTKEALLGQQNLERVTEVATRSKDAHSSASKAFQWLKSVCSNPNYGVFRPSGWYPPGTTVNSNGPRSKDIIDLGLDSIDFYDRDDRPDIRNSTLLSWTLTLRPHTSLLERELVLICFASSPELASAYFATNVMQFEPKLSNTWVGYASFLFEVVHLSVPSFLGNEKEWAQLPPQSHIMIESILPRPLTQKVLTRCLNRSSELVTFFAARLLVLAFQKLTQVRAQLNEGADASTGRASLWNAASERLLARFIERCPRMKDVVTVFRKLPDDDEHALQRETFAKLIQLYYEVTPREALEDPFDVSTILTTVLERGLSESQSNESRELRALELKHLLQIARQSTGMRWLNKQGALEFSPLVTLLKIHKGDLQNRPIRELLCHVLIENNILNSDIACDALIASLVDMDDSSAASVESFLDECFTRASQRPVKYLDDFDAMSSLAQYDDGTAENPPSLLIAVLLEQASFVAAKSTAERDSLVSWISGYLDLSIVFEGKSTTTGIIEQIKTTLGLWTSPPSRKDREELLSKVRLAQPLQDPARIITNGSPQEVVLAFAPPPIETEDHPELLKWAKKDLEIAIEDGDIDALFLCLCSQYAAIRAQAVSQLYKLQHAVHNCALEDKEPIYVVLGELIETYERHFLTNSEALPYLAGAFATNALHVQMQPAHFMYGKVNKYLNKGPEWRMQKMPSYWIDNIVLSTPEEDDSYWEEAEWVLGWLVDGLRSPADLEILRRAGIFERVVSFCDSPGAAARKQIKDKVLELLWRATFVANGSTTLITRTGVLSWLDMTKTGDDGREEALRKQIIETCERVRIEQWSGMELEDM